MNGLGMKPFFFSTLLTGVVLCVGGWGWSLTEAQREECEWRASQKATDFSARQAYERCKKTIKQEYKEREEAEIREQERLRELELRREEKRKQKAAAKAQRKAAIKREAEKINARCFNNLEKMQAFRSRYHPYLENRPMWTPEYHRDEAVVVALLLNEDAPAELFDDARVTARSIAERACNPDDEQVLLLRYILAEKIINSRR